MVYILGTLISMLLAYFAQKNREQNKFLFCFFAFLSFIPLTLIAAVRYEIGSDYGVYLDIYRNGAVQYKTQEPVFYLLVKFLRMFSEEPQTIYIAVAVIFCGCYYFTIFKESSDPVLSILLFLITREYFCSMTSIRQLLGTSILITSIPLLKEKKWVPSAILFLIACLIHNAIVVSALLIIMCFANLKPVYYIIITILAYILPKYMQQIFVKMVSFCVPHAIGYFANFAPGFEASTFMAFAGIFIFVLIRYNKTKENTNIRLLYNGLAFGIIMLAFAGATHWANIRLSYFTHPLIILYFSDFLDSYENERVRTALTVLFLVGYSIVCLWISLSGNQEVLNYRTVFSV